jgi:radical SAM-linked protein
MLVRVKYSKTPEGRFLSHLDQVRTMERIFRRAGLPLAFSEGFNPHPKVSYGSALAVGVTSEGEYLDLELREYLPPEEIMERLRPVMPPGLKVLELKEIKDRTVSLAALINMARYRVEIPEDGEISEQQAGEAVERTLTCSIYTVTRKGKNGPREVELRKGIHALCGRLENGRWLLFMDVATGSQGNVKPEEVVGMLADLGGIKLSNKRMRIHRLGLFVKDGQEIKTPLEMG